MDNIVILEKPIMARTMDWEFAHPDCDSIIDDSDVDDKIIILAYAANKDGNLELERYRDQYFVDKEILVGISKDAVNRFL